MALFDMPLADLRVYQPELDGPDDFDAFWSRTLEQAAGYELAVRFERPATALTEVEVYDASFAGWGGHRVCGWLIVPKHAPRPVACVVQYLGYHRGRGCAHDHLMWPATGRAVFVVDTRGQGAVAADHAGDTADPVGGEHPQSPGFVTRGIRDPEQYYYRRVFTDAVRAVALMDRTCPPSTVFASYNHWAQPDQVHRGLPVERPRRWFGNAS